MFKRQTLFVLGAGASFEAGLPTGKDIAQTIGKKMDIRFEHFNKHIGGGDLQLFAQLTNNLQKNPNEFQNAAWLIRDGIGYAQSIDDFLDQHRKNAYVNFYGKAAIVKTILEAERNSKIFFNRFAGQEAFEVSPIADTWFIKFMYMLGRGVPKENVREILDNVAFIVFNYDRCVEHFLTHALRKLYHIGEDEAASIVADLHIIHPYGVVPDNIPFGSSGANCVQAVDQIKTYTEQSGAADVISEIAAEIHRAKCIVFLGFAYHSQNMNLLRPAKPAMARPVFGTALGMSDSDVEVVLNDLSIFFSMGVPSKVRARIIRLENKLTCANLFDNYARSLSGGD
jgi:hypothetical protein